MSTLCLENRRGSEGPTPEPLLDKWPEAEAGKGATSGDFPFHVACEHDIKKSCLFALGSRQFEPFLRMLGAKRLPCYCWYSNHAGSNFIDKQCCKSFSVLIAWFHACSVQESVQSGLCFCRRAFAFNAREVIGSHFCARTLWHG